jgi:hypothetical protein
MTWVLLWSWLWHALIWYFIMKLNMARYSDVARCLLMKSNMRFNLILNIIQCLIMKSNVVQLLIDTQIWFNIHFNLILNMIRYLIMKSNVVQLLIIRLIIMRFNLIFRYNSMLDYEVECGSILHSYMIQCLITKSNVVRFFDYETDYNVL